MTLKKIPKFYLFKASIIYILQHHFKGPNLERLRLKNLRQIVHHLSSQKQSEQTTKVIEVDRRDNLSETEFVHQYLKKGIPVIFEQQAQNWTCVQKWNFNFLKNKFSDITVNIVEPDGLFEKKDFSRSSDLHISQITINEFVENISDEESPYLRFSPITDIDRSLIQDLDLVWLKKMRRGLFGVSYQNFIGPKNRKTPLHSETLPFFSIMVDGEKKWTLYAPSAFPILNPVPSGKGYHHTEINIQEVNESYHPEVALLDKYTCHLRKGDILFVPSWMWHEVENVTDSWGLSYQFTSVPSILSEPTLAFVRFFMTKPSFIKVIFNSFFGSDISRKKKNFITPKIWFKD